jgi:hypothetical protein
MSDKEETKEQRIERLKREWDIPQEVTDRAIAKRHAAERAEGAEFPDGEPSTIIDRPVDE